MKLRTCQRCDWSVPFDAEFCVRCGAPQARGQGLAKIALTAGQHQGITDAFVRSRLLPALAGGAAPAGLAWTAFGSSAAVLVQNGTTTALERLSLTAAGARVEPWLERTVLSAVISPGVNTLVAPPIAARLGVALVSTGLLEFFVHPGVRQGEIAQRQVIRWRPNPGETIRGAALSPEGDLYVAVAGDGGSIAIHDESGNLLLRLDAITAVGDGGVGLAIQGSKGEAIVYAWSGDLMGWGPLDDSRADNTVTVLPWPAVAAPRRAWQERLDEPVAWHGWRDAAVGAYPTMFEEMGRQVFGALCAAGGQPVLVRYHDAKPRIVASGAPAALLFTDESGLRAVHPRTGALIARRAVGVTAEIICGLSGGGFLSLENHRSGDTVVLTGWSVRAGEIVKAFETQLRAPGGGVQHAPLQATPEMPPVEIDDGLAVALLEGAGSESRLRLWCEHDAFVAGRAA